MTDKAKQLLDSSNISRLRTKRYSDNAVRLGETVKELVEGRISRQQARLGPVVEQWDRLLPDELREHCRIADISGGQLKVQVDSPSYEYELRLCSSEILAELQARCPGARIEKIKFMPGGVFSDK